MARMIALSHRHNGNCGRGRWCCVCDSYTRKGRLLNSIRKAQRAFEKDEWRRDNDGSGHG